MVDVGLIGVPGAGKTTVFNLLTGAGAETSPYGGRTEAHRALAPVPDSRLDDLAQLFHPRKVTAAQIQVVDVPGLARTDQGGPNRFLNDVRAVDALVHVVRAYDSALMGSADPLAEASDMELELGLSDLDLLERRRDRLQGGKKLTAEARAELPLIDRLIAVLESGGRLTQVDLDDEEARFLRGYQFLTMKPMVWVLNLDEDRLVQGKFPGQNAVLELAHTKNIPVVTMAGQWEMEAMALQGEERLEFLRALGLQETGISRLARAVYHRLGLISFLTAGEDEVRAWAIMEGTTAKAAAGKIHSDIERGFIRAEVVAFADLAEAGSMSRARERGLVRMEGKDYVMRDGDVVNFRFNV